MKPIAFRLVLESQRFFYNGFWWTRRHEFQTDSGSTANAICDNGLITWVGPNEEVFVEE